MIKKDLPLHEVNVWHDPLKHPVLTGYSEEYFIKSDELSKFILQAIALAFGKKEKNFHQYFRKKIICHQLIWLDIHIWKINHQPLLQLLVKSLVLAAMLMLDSCPYWPRKIFKICKC